MTFIYLDNAATSYPKPSGCMQRALDRYLKIGASPSRGGYDLAMEAEDSRIRGQGQRFAVSLEQERITRFASAATQPMP